MADAACGRVHNARGTQVSRTAPVLLAPLLLIFTGGELARAQTSHEDLFPPEPAPGARNGPGLRLGTVTGYEVFADKRVSALGGHVAVSARLGPVSAEAEYSHLMLYEPDERPEHSGNTQIGELDRIGVTGRLDIDALSRLMVGPRSRLVLWLEAGLGAQRGRWYTGQAFQRSDRVAGAGWLLDHRLKRPLGFPSRIGWHFGWRVVLPSEPRPAYTASIVCKATGCANEDADRHVGLLVSSGMQFSW
jgi:hypothetical protein